MPQCKTSGMRLLTAVFALVATLPGLAMAQPPDPPRAELGVQVSTQTGQARAVTWSPQITLNLTPITAIEGSADFQLARTDPFGTRTSGRVFSLHWRQALFTSGRWLVFGVFGAGDSRQVFEFPERIVERRDGPEMFPAQKYVDTGLAVQLGPAVQFEAAPWLALRGDLRLTAGDNGGLRGMVGAVVPVGRFRAGDRPGVSSQTPPLAAWHRLKAGREVWVTTSSGALVHGEVSTISDRSLGALRKTDWPAHVRARSI